MQLGDKVEGTYSFCDGILYVFTDTKIYEHCILDDEEITLDKCLQKIDYKNGVCRVLVDGAMSGMVFIYGNHGKYWEYYGKTMGFA